MAPPLPGYRKAKGRQERYRPPKSYKGPRAADGTISRRQYENVRVQAYGWRSWAEYQHDRDSDDYRRWRGEFVEKNKDDPLASSRGPDSEFAEYWLDAKRSGWDTDVHGPFANLLVATGHREPEWEFDVGDTP